MPKQTKPQKNILFKDKGEFTKFQILLEVLRHQPHTKQKDISEKLGITIQAVSKYFKVLRREGLLEGGSVRADYHPTAKGLLKLRDDVRGLENYLIELKNDIKLDHAWPAIATQPVQAGQQVGLLMKEGVIYTVPTNSASSEATGIALSDAKEGEDLGLKDLQGKLEVKQGKILIVKLPSIRRGGSRSTDLEKIKAFCDEFKPDRIGVMGAVGRAVLAKMELKADIEFGISRSAAIAASRGLNVFVLVVGRMVNRMIEEIDQINLRNERSIAYEVKDAQKNYSARKTNNAIACAF
jgi:putative transcriptional regulator